MNKEVMSSIGSHLEYVVPIGISGVMPVGRRVARPQDEVRFWVDHPHRANGGRHHQPAAVAGVVAKLAGVGVGGGICQKHIPKIG